MEGKGSFNILKFTLCLSVTLAYTELLKRTIETSIILKKEIGINEKLHESSASTQGCAYNQSQIHLKLSDKLYINTWRENL